MSGELDEFIKAAAEQTGRDPDLLALEEAASRLHAKGIDFTVQHGKVLTGPHEPIAEHALDLGKQHIRLGLVSDTHGGSMHEQLTALRTFYRYVEQEGVDAFVHTGDVTQGSDRMHRDAYLSIHAHGADAQVAYVAATYPVASVPTYVITGNHDDSFLVDGGMNVVRRIVALRPDLRYVGQDAAYLTIEQLRMYLIHPDGGVPYAKSYRAQKIHESLPEEKPVHLGIVGHLHVYATVLQKGTLMLNVPCFQSQYGWLARKALRPQVGGVLLDVWLDDAGRLARMRHELVSFEPIEDDWDREASAAVARGWSPMETAA